jgi:hypothetical protein
VSGPASGPPEMTRADDGANGSRAARRGRRQHVGFRGGVEADVNGWHRG